MAISKWQRTWWLLVSCLATPIQLTESLSFSAVHIPALVQRNTNFWLSCQFKLLKLEQLYSVKWYRNNEEFYRLQVTDNQLTATNLTSVNYWQQPSAFAPIANNGQQQYFAQEGLNVMMSSSNATHVRLLNASLESEGVYACEISTQNLSTIRYEKEIRVYVLPNSRLTIIGLRNRYAVGDRVDLICASDYSRAQSALAWFINGRRIAKTSQWFALDSQRKNKANLVKLQLGLKFKLSPQLLNALLSSAVATTEQQRNQSLAKPNPFRRRRRRRRAVVQRLPNSTSSLHHQQHNMRLNSEFELKIQCKYKLTEVSDVTFNELLLSLRDRKSALAVDLNEANESLRSKRQVNQLFTDTEVPIRLAKTAQNQVTQTPSPTSARNLFTALAIDRAACQAGVPALVPEDPLIVASNRPNGSQDDESWWSSSESLVAQQRRKRGDNNREDGGDENKDRKEQPNISLTCLTISALLAKGESSTESIGDFTAIPTTLTTSADSFADTSTAATTTTAMQRAPNYCSESTSRRRALISGRYQTNEEQLMSSGSQHRGQQASSSHQLPVNRSHAKSSSFGSQQQQQQQQQQRVATNLIAYLTLTEPFTWLRPSAESSELSLPSSWSLSSTLSAPPLLEWFINNQEAPPSSLSLVRSSGGADDDDEQPAQTAPPEPVALPMDFADYFANFDNRPLEQQLTLNLSLNKKLFMTPDAQLRLRCSSTQVQVLLTDSATVSIVALTPNQQHSEATQQPLSGWNQRSNQRQRQILNHQAHLAARSNGAAQVSLRPGDVLAAALLSHILYYMWLLRS